MTVDENGLHLMKIEKRKEVITCDILPVAMFKLKAQGSNKVNGPQIAHIFSGKSQTRNYLRLSKWS